MNSIRPTRCQVDKNKKEERKINKNKELICPALIKLNNTWDKPDIFEDPVVICKIEEKRYPLLVDTGSRVTLINREILKDAKRQIIKIEEEPAKLHGITGHPIKCKGIYMLKLKLGSIEFKHPCYVVDLTVTSPHKGILGRDVLKRFNINISFADSKLIFHNGEEIKFNNAITNLNEMQTTKNADKKISHSAPLESRTKDKKTQSRDRMKIKDRNFPVRLIKLTGRNIVPPRSEVIITGKVVGRGRPKPRSVGVVEPDAINVKGILGANILVTVNKRGNIPIRLINITHRPIVLHKNKKIGKFVAVQETATENNNRTKQHNLEKE